jgi:hypothetical protein
MLSIRVNFWKNEATDTKRGWWTELLYLFSNHSSSENQRVVSIELYAIFFSLFFDRYAFRFAQASHLETMLSTRGNTDTHSLLALGLYLRSWSGSSEIEVKHGRYRAEPVSQLTCAATVYTDSH